MAIQLTFDNAVLTSLSPFSPHQGPLHIKRDDLIHPIISGNKARKLKQLRKRFLSEKPEHLLTMGGNHSNFLHALGFLCQQESITLTALIRGPEPAKYSATLRDLSDWGTQLKFVDRTRFKALRESPSLVQSLALEHKAQWLPEGGSDTDALTGIMTAIDELSEAPDIVFIPAGTGCTALGLALGLAKRAWHTQVVAVVTLKGAHRFEQDLRQLCHESGFPWPDNLVFEYDFCGKGFGKITHELEQDQRRFEEHWQIPLEPVYTTRMIQAYQHYAHVGLIDSTAKVLLWHTGGLQGNRA